MRVVPSAFLGVGEDLVGMDELLELGGGVGLGETGFDELVRVALEGELPVGRADLFRSAVLREAQYLVEASLLRRH